MNESQEAQFYQSIVNKNLLTAWRLQLWRIQNTFGLGAKKVPATPLISLCVSLFSSLKTWLRAYLKGYCADINRDNICEKL